MENKQRNNNVQLSGEITSDFKYSHSVFGIKHYTFYLSIMRTSKFCDVIPLIISERRLNFYHNYTGKSVTILGELQSFNTIEQKKKLFVYVFVRKFEFVHEMHHFKMENHVFIHGALCKNPIYRITPLGRQISDLHIAVIRNDTKKDYIPCICWGRNAKTISKFGPGTIVQIKGRIQSREYEKKLKENVTEIRIAFEVSITEIQIETAL